MKMGRTDIWGSVALGFASDVAAAVSDGTVRRAFRVDAVLGAVSLVAAGSSVEPAAAAAAELWRAAAGWDSRSDAERALRARVGWLSSLPDAVEAGWLSTVSELGTADAAAVGDVEEARDADTFEVCLPAAGPLTVRADPERALLPDSEPLADARGESDEPVPVSAEAIAHVVKTPAPTPKATARPPTRPMYFEALIIPPNRSATSRDRALSKDH